MDPITRLLILSLLVVWLSVFIQNQSFANVFSRRSSDTHSDSPGLFRVRETYHKVVDSKDRKSDPSSGTVTKPESDSFRFRKTYHNIVDKKTTTQPNINPNARPNVNPNAYPNPNFNPNINPNAYPNPNARPNVNPNINPNPNAYPNPNVNPNINPNAYPNPNARPNVNPNVNPNINPNAYPNPNVRPNPNPNAYPNQNFNAAYQPGYNPNLNPNIIPPQYGWNIGQTNVILPNQPEQRGGISNLKYLANIIKKNPNYGSSNHLSRPGYYYDQNLRPDRYSDISGRICINNQNYDGIIYGQIQCPLSGYGYDETECCGPINYQYCCRPSYNKKSGIGFISGSIFVIVIILLALCCSFGLCFFKLKSKKTKASSEEKAVNEIEKSPLSKESIDNTDKINEANS